MKTYKGVQLDSISKIKPAKGYGGLDGRQDLVTYAFSILALFLLFALSTPCSAYGSDEVDSYIKSVLQLVELHREALPRLIAPANATADAVTHGGAFYLAGDKGWIAEGD